ncbi:HNH endonuclease [Microcoleus sp. B4-C1]|uniref:HNH endonuclease n=1 Tax=Microcoleus sp. B4-C1 TaxID=2818660 RepID=UPI002FD1C3D6
MLCRRNLPIQEKIQQHIISKEDCWITDLSSPKGYPRIGHNQKMRKVSRVMFELHYGEIPEGMYVCHKCDNRACVNPEHLFLGTHQDNMADMVKKNRQAKGSNQGSSKLTEKQVAEIKFLLAEGKLMQKEIAQKFGIRPSYVSAIKCGKKWKHLSHQPINNYSEPKQLNLFD